MVLLVRGYARTVAAVLVVLSLWSLPHLSLPDICVPEGAEHHDETKHVFTAAPEASHTEHCAICHWMRTLKPTFEDGQRSAVTLDAGAPVIVVTSRVRRDDVRVHLPARAPPVFLS